MRPDVSIVVPVYNAEKTISRCIDSLLKQTYASFEIIVVNDASTDDTLNILLDYKDKIRLINNLHNRGEGYSRNEGLLAANGLALMFVDADDYVSRTFVSNAMQHFDLRLDLIVFDYYQYKNGVKQEIKLNSRSDNPFENFLRGGLNGGVWNKLFRLDIIRRYDLRFNEYIYVGTDTVFIAQYASVSLNVKYTGTCDYYYILSDNSVTNRITKKSFLFLSYIDEMTKYHSHPYFGEYKSLFAHNIMRKLIFYNRDYCDVERQVCCTLRSHIKDWLFSKEINLKLKCLFLIACFNVGLYKIILRGLHGR